MNLSFYEICQDDYIFINHKACDRRSSELISIGGEHKHVFFHGMGNIVFAGHLVAVCINPVAQIHRDLTNHRGRVSESRPLTLIKWNTCKLGTAINMDRAKPLSNALSPLGMLFIITSTQGEALVVTHWLFLNVDGSGCLFFCALRLEGVMKGRGVTAWVLGVGS